MSHCFDEVILAERTSLFRSMGEWAIADNLERHLMVSRERLAMKREVRVMNEGFCTTFYKLCVRVVFQSKIFGVLSLCFTLMNAPEGRHAGPNLHYRNNNPIQPPYKWWEFAWTLRFTALTGHLLFKDRLLAIPCITPLRPTHHTGQSRPAQPHTTHSMM